MTQTVLVAGATGMLGGRIAHYLLQEPDTQVKVLVRPATLKDAEKKAQLTALQDHGARIVEGDMVDTESLARATASVDVVVSAVQGGPEILIDGQLALLEAAKKNGVRRFLPSDFALDLFKTPEGMNVAYDMRRTSDATIQASGMEYIHVLSGVFMDVFLFASAMVDRQNAVAHLWGSGNERFETTSVEDTARYTAKAALDRELPNGKFAIAGQRISLEEITQRFEQVTGKTFQRDRLGSIADLEAQIAHKRETNPDPMATLIDTYQLIMLTGVGALSDLQNDRYLDIQPEDFTTFLQHSLRDK